MARPLMLRSQSKTGGRLIFVGDIHGCFDELRELLSRVAPAANDVVVSVGDVVTKGPAADRCLDLWRERGYLAVQGNNEIKLLHRARPLLRLFAQEDRAVLRRRDLLQYIESWPLVIDFPQERVTAVHGGFLPQMQVTAEDIERERDVIPQLRWIRKQDGEWRPVPKEKKRKDDVLWSEKWRGDRFVLYGHTPLREPKRDKQALGLDTGCVYGGSLTAAVLTDGHWETVSVSAKRKYAE
jgi:diadenosine tetraphosphatase ApaH/serine/threonine PP2A family protein phosphatase